MSWNAHDYDGETNASRAEDARENAIRMDREEDEAREARRVYEQGSDEDPAYTVIEWTDNRWLGIADGPVTVRRRRAA
jgi:hypothetical protein